MLYTIIDIYEVMRTDDIYPQSIDSIGKNECCDSTCDNDMICTDPYKFLHII